MSESKQIENKARLTIRQQKKLCKIVQDPEEKKIILKETEMMGPEFVEEFISEFEELKSGFENFDLDQKTKLE